MGRHPFDCQLELIQQYQLDKHSWTDIARMLTVTPKTLRLWRDRINFNDPWPAINEDMIDEEIGKFTLDKPLVGEVSITSYLLGAKEMYCTRQQIRSSILRVQPSQLSLRRETFGRQLIRRVYDIKAPHYLWYFDGWHKLIRFQSTY